MTAPTPECELHSAAVAVAEAANRIWELMRKRATAAHADPGDHSAVHVICEANRELDVARGDYDRALDAYRAARTSPQEPSRGESSCSACQGRGHYTYGDTAAYLSVGGMAFAAITPEICDRCWGSGDEARPFTNLRKRHERMSAGMRVAVADKRLREHLDTEHGVNSTAEWNTWEAKEAEMKGVLDQARADFDAAEEG